MKELSKRLGAAVFAITCCGAVVAMAETDMPPEMSQGVARYVTGGIGTDEQDAIKAAARSYPLELQFVVRGDPDWSGRVFTAGIGVTVRDGGGKVVLDAKANGPYMLAKLPDGDYTISANGNGQTTTKRVRIEQAKHQTVVFEWGS